MRLAVALAIVGIASFACASLDREGRSAPVAETREGVASSNTGDSGLVVVELFTSQGCSSCPPADRLLARLADDPRYRGRIVPLAFHVDYWDYIGWRDPFSSKEWTSRQYEYSRALGLSGVYTPQVVVNGQAEAVGSDERAVVADIEAASREQTATVHATATFETPIRLSARIDVAAAAGADVANATLVVALFESGIETTVQRGENAGRVLQNDFAVRRLEQIPGIPLASRGAIQNTVAFDVDPAWNKQGLGIAAFLQDPTTMRIFGAAVAQPR